MKQAFHIVILHTSLSVLIVLISTYSTGTLIFFSESPSPVYPLQQSQTPPTVDVTMADFSPLEFVHMSSPRKPQVPKKIRYNTLSWECLLIIYINNKNLSKGN